MTNHGGQNQFQDFGVYGVLVIDFAHPTRLGG